MTAQPFYSTHDWTVSSVESTPFSEVWVDAKSPGNGRTYVVGTIEVRTTVDPVFFSNSPISREPLGWPVVNIIGALSLRRQVVCVQCVNADQSIAWQRFFYGRTTGLTESNNLRATNARGISVWPAATDAETRVAICGETYDEILPISNAPGGWPLVNGTNPSGFLAVYNGAGTLLWTHHFFAPTLNNCAITDVAIRREGLASETPTDVVTYCGISSHGVPAGSSPLTPERFHTTTQYLGSSVGNTNHGEAQWDGIVGRLSKTAAGTAVRVFHTVLGGPAQDGLFGIAELDSNRFAVVGSATKTPGVPGEFPLAPPFQNPGNSVSVAPIVIFDAAPTRTGGNVVLESSWGVGQQNDGSEVPPHTIARDVAIGRRILNASEDYLYVVGSTDHKALQLEVKTPPLVGLPPDDTAANQENLGFLRGLTDGWCGVFRDLGPFSNPLVLLPQAVAYFGGFDDDGLTGVQNWNEFSEHITVVGFYGEEIRVETLLFDTTMQGSAVLRRVRQREFGSSGSTDRPAATGAIHTLDNANTVPWDRKSLGDPNGGGVTVDEKGRVTIAGMTVGNTYPTVNAPTVTARGHDVGTDAVRTVSDMIPQGVGRTDGTGAGIPGGLPPSFVGGTTPTCALSPFGITIQHGNGGPDGLRFPGLQRMLVDYEGPQPPAVTNAFLIVSRPSYDPVLPLPNAQFMTFQFNVPNSTPPIMLPEGVEVWTTNGNAIVTFTGLPFEAIRVSLGTLPPGIAFTIQGVLFVFHPVPGFGCLGATTSLVGTPALWFQN